ncbi:MAG: FkbM family methyltransferase [Planctomycetaceae bacterium]
MTPEEQIQRGFGMLAEARERIQEQLNMTQGPERGQLRQQLWNCSRHEAHSLYLSQAGQDQFIDQYLLNGKRDGVFVDVGGYDGCIGSNSYFFETVRGWSGLLIEPVRELCETARAIRRCRCLNECVSETHGECEFVQITRGFTQMSGLRDSYAAHILQTVRAHPDHAEQSITVRTRPLAEILREHECFEIDCLFIDVEGAENRILSAFPFGEFQITVCCLENNSGDAEIGRLMARNGFECVEFIGADEIYTAT